MELSDFTPAKRRIFETAVELFERHTYEQVTMSDIATALQRTKPTIYNHFASKQDILDTMYDFFEEHFLDERSPLEVLIPKLERGSVLDMILALTFEFPAAYRQIMGMIFSVIHQRKYSDDRAKEIARRLLVDEGIRYARAAFDYAIAIGRLAPFNTEWLAIVINDTRNGEYMRAMLDPVNYEATYMTRIEIMVYQHAAAIITDLRPPYRRSGPVRADA
ncbi:TetR/AcrR family transcriptional regulator [Eubacteriales bacterium OttesenSCG-928-A19]|nr:TetR/AcrR family transcriptional regulator [Eubacteriales bacterium OttesenSCG-928-A19]